MLALRSVNVRDNFKEWCNKVSMGETVVISNSRNETEYNALQKAKRNSEYLEKIEENKKLYPC